MVKIGISKLGIVKLGIAKFGIVKLGIAKLGILKNRINFYKFCKISYKKLNLSFIKLSESPLFRTV